MPIFNEPSASSPSSFRERQQKRSVTAATTAKTKALFISSAGVACFFGFSALSSLLSSASAQPLSPSYDGYRYARDSITPKPAAQQLYDNLYYTNIRDFAPCVLTAQLQLTGGDDSAGGGNVTKQSSIHVSGPFENSFTPHSSGGSFSPSSSPATDLLLLNSTLLKGCADRLIFSPIYTGTPDASANNLVLEKGLYKASHTVDERSGSQTANFNAVRSRGQLLPVEVLSDLIIFADVLGECVVKTPSWQPSNAFNASSSSISGRMPLILTALADRLLSSHEDLDFKAIVDWIRDDQIGAKKKASNNVPESPSTGGIIQRTSITLAIAPDLSADIVGSAEGFTQHILGTSAPLDSNNKAFMNLIQKKFSFNQDDSLGQTSNVTTVGDLILLLDALPSLTSLESLVSSCVRRQIRHNPLLYSDAEGGSGDAHNLPISAISGVLLGDDSIALLKGFVVTMASAIRRVQNLDVDDDRDKKEAIVNTLAPFIASYALPHDTLVAASSAADHIQLAHYFTLGPAAVGILASGLDGPKYLLTTTASPSSDNVLSFASSPRELLEDVFQSDGYFYHNYTSRSSSSDGASSNNKPHYYTAQLIGSFLPRAQQWDAIKGNAFFNSVQVFRKRLLTSASSDRRLSETKPTFASVPLHFRPSYQYQSKAAMRLASQSPIVHLTPHQLENRESHSENENSNVQHSSGRAFGVSSSSLSSASLLTDESFSEPYSPGMSSPMTSKLRPFLQHLQSLAASAVDIGASAVKQKLKALGGTEFDKGVHDAAQEQKGDAVATFVSQPHQGTVGFESRSEGPALIRPPLDHLETIDEDTNSDINNGAVIPLLPKSSAQNNNKDNNERGARTAFRAQSSVGGGGEDDDHNSALTSNVPRKQGESWSNFFSAPICLESKPNTCSLVGGLNVWGTSSMVPKGYFTVAAPKVNASMMSLETTAASAASSSTSATPQPATFTNRFTPNGSIAVMVSSASTASLFHDISPSASAAAADVAALLLVIDTISRSLLPTMVFNGSLAREVLDLSPADQTVANETSAEEDERVLSALSQIYFFFFTGDDGAGFGGSGRFIKESLTFRCGAVPKAEANSPSAIDCNFPFYWFTNFTRTVEFSNFTHFVALDGVLGSGAAETERIVRLSEELMLTKIVEEMSLLSATEALYKEEMMRTNRIQIADAISLEAAEQYQFYAYTDAQLNAISPAQQLVNTVLRDAINGSSSTTSSLSFASVDSSSSANELALQGRFVNETAVINNYGNTASSSSVLVSITASTQNSTVLVDLPSAQLSDDLSSNRTNSTLFTILNVSYTNRSSASSPSTAATPRNLKLSTTIPPSSLWSFLVSAYGDVTSEALNAFIFSRSQYFIPSAWKSRSFTLISAVKPDPLRSDVTSETTEHGEAAASRYYYAGGALSASSASALRTARSSSGALDTYAALMLDGGGSESRVVMSSSSSQQKQSNFSFALSASSRLQIRRRIIHKQLAAAADIVANLLAGLVLEGSLKPLAAKSADPLRAAKAIEDATANLKKAGGGQQDGSNDSGKRLLMIRSDFFEAQRLLYCTAGNTNCVYLGGADGGGERFTNAERHSIPTIKNNTASSSSSSSDSTASSRSFFRSVGGPNYYHGVFSYYYTIPAANGRMLMNYMTDRLKSSYNQRIGAWKQPVDSSSSSASSSSSPISPQLNASFGIPCDPNKAMVVTANGEPMNCPARYQQCLRDYYFPLASSSDDNGSGGGVVTQPNVTYSCYPLTAFYSHSFAPAARYNPFKPSVAAYMADWAFINGQLEETVISANSAASNGGGGGDNDSNNTSSAFFITRQQLAGLFYGLRIEVESYWSSGAASEIGARTALVASPSILWTTFGLGLVSLCFCIVICIVYYCLFQPRVLSRAEAEELERVRTAAGATETKTFYFPAGADGDDGGGEGAPSATSLAVINSQTTVGAAADEGIVVNSAGDEGGGSKGRRQQKVVVRYA